MCNASSKLQSSLYNFKMVIMKECYIMSWGEGVLRHLRLFGISFSLMASVEKYRLFWVRNRKMEKIQLSVKLFKKPVHARNETNWMNQWMTRLAITRISNLESGLIKKYMKKLINEWTGQQYTDKPNDHKFQTD